MASKPTDASMPFLNLGKEQTEAMLSIQKELLDTYDQSSLFQGIFVMILELLRLEVARFGLDDVGGKFQHVRSEHAARADGLETAGDCLPSTLSSVQAGIVSLGGIGATELRSRFKGAAHVVTTVIASASG